jgi:cytochrome c oxidase subunit 2
MGMNFQDPATVVMEGIIDLHHNIFFYMIVVLVVVSWMLFQITVEYCVKMYLGGTSVEDMLRARRDSLKLSGIVHGKVLEIVWTLVPTFVLIAIAIPSFALLYSMDELIEPTLTIKAIGHQWYWSYEYSDYESADLTFDSYMVPENDLSLGQLRLLEVDRKVWVPVETHVRVVITATDVLHCWAIPALGVKLDAVPGRLNQTGIFVKREGVFNGQCSEICGVNHGFMPIAVKAVPMSLYNYWVDLNLSK